MIGGYSINRVSLTPILSAFSAVWLSALPVASAAQEACRQALALGLDISGSVDSQEYRTQMDGLAGALTDPGVIDAFLALPDAPVRLYIYEWAGLGTQRTVIDWVSIRDDETLYGIASTLADFPRGQREVPTALGVAIRFGLDQLSDQSDCWKLTLDISGDGKSNMGPRPRDLKPEIARSGVVINALVIGADAAASSDQRYVEIGELVQYFRADVIAGADAFAVSALGFDDYKRAMTRKLLRELEVLAVGQLQLAD